MASCHVHNSKENPVSGCKSTGEVTRSDSEELGRLKNRYPVDEVERLFPGVSVKLPATFDEAMKIVMELITSGKTKEAAKRK
jgi:hypothetical protein